jgi:cell division protein FtsI/penicillin-binding protein 2
MFTSKQIRIIRYAARGLIVACFALALYGYLEKESDLQDNERVELFNKAFKDGYIVINQPSPGQPLEPTVVEYSQLTPADQKLYEQKRWDRMRRQTYRFVAAVNQGLGDPFEYGETEEGRSYVVKVKEASLRYNNPFEVKRPGPITTPINSSEEVARSRPGWRIVSKDLVLYLRPDAAPVQVSAAEQYACEVGGEFLLASRSGNGTALRISAEGQGKLQVLKLEARGTDQARKPAQLTRKNGEYFIWDGRPFSIYRSDTVIGDADDPTVGDLVFTKSVNGKSRRVQVLGRATANLIGSPVGGETSYIDGSFLHNKARRLVLTIDPEIQSGAFYLLYSGLKKLDNDHPSSKLQRPRKGSITVLDADTGQVLANVGTPGYDPTWEGDRVILANRQRIIENPANLPHMPGSSVKVLTGGIGYLMYGDGSGEMLPASINKLAIRQAFRNTYGGQMPPDNIVESTEQANATEAGDRYFENNGGAQRVKEDFVKVLNSAFYVMQYKPEDYKFFDSDESVRKELYEHVVLGDLESYFDLSAKYSFFPQRSRFPVKDADSMEVFRQYAIGASETRLTTLRLATILDEVTSGRLVHPFIVESVYDPVVKGNNNRVSNRKADVFADLRTALPDFEGVHNGNEQRMTEEMRRYLQWVCERKPGTGWYLNSENNPVYINQDDSSTKNFDEGKSRQGGFGKTGTADYGALDPFNDSVFVYRHGRYIVAVWMERSDGNGVVHPAHAMLNQVVKLIEKLEPPHS